MEMDIDGKKAEEGVYEHHSASHVNTQRQHCLI
jgi:hypothetical protein